MVILFRVNRIDPEARNKQAFIGKIQGGPDLLILRADP
jgi:hypothetical protein